MSRRLTKYMKTKTMNTYCPKCEAEAGQPCHGVNGGWANLHEERKMNARKRNPVSGPVKKKAPKQDKTYVNNKAAWDALPEDQRAVVLGRTCPVCQAVVGANCKSTTGGNHLPQPHKERMIGQAYTTNACPTCYAEKGEDCKRGNGLPYTAGYVHVARRELLAPVGPLTQISYAPVGVKPPMKSDLIIIGDEEDVLEPTTRRDKNVLLTEEMAKGLAAHLRGTTLLQPETVAFFADMLDHIPTPVEIAAAKLSGLDLEDFLDRPLEQREEFLDAFREAMGAYIENLIGAVPATFPEAVMDAVLIDLV